jgi:uncharacterized protein
MDPIVWQGLSEPSLEYLDLGVDPAPKARGTIVSVWDGEPIRLAYEIDCDPDWLVRRVEARLDTGSGERHLALQASRDGAWTDDTGRALPELTGCSYVDIQATPFTNSLPIRRMDLAPGETRDLRVAYVGVPSLEVSAADQRYTRLEDAASPRYRYESGGFSALLVVDEAGIVVDYESLWRRIAPASTQP